MSEESCPCCDSETCDACDQLRERVERLEEALRSIIGVLRPHFDDEENLCLEDDLFTIIDRVYLPPADARGEKGGEDGPDDH